MLNPALRKSVLPKPVLLTRAASLVTAALLTLTLSACGAVAESAADTTKAAEAVTVSDPWVRATSGTEEPSMTAAYMAIDNDGDADVSLVSASSPVTAMVELHEMALVDGASMMREVADGILLEPGRGQLLQPGGLHVMLMGLDQELAPGDEVDLVLEFSDGSTVEVTAPVKEFTEETEHYHAPGTDENHSH